MWRVNLTSVLPKLADPAGRPKAPSTSDKSLKTELLRLVLKSVASGSLSPSLLNRFVIGSEIRPSTEKSNTPSGNTAASSAKVRGNGGTTPKMISARTVQDRFVFPLINVFLHSLGDSTFHKRYGKRRECRNEVRIGKNIPMVRIEGLFF